MAPQLELTGVVPCWTLGDRLRKARNEAGLDQDALAADLQISRRSVQLYENDASVPKRPVLIAWAIRCQVDFSWMIGADDADPTSGDSAEIASSIYFHGNESSHTGEADQAIDAQRVLVMAS